MVVKWFGEMDIYFLMDVMVNADRQGLTLPAINVTQSIQNSSDQSKDTFL